MSAPEPLTPPDCDVSELPFPDELMVELMSDAGRTAEEARDLALSLGWVRVPGGWKAGH